MTGPRKRMCRLCTLDTLDHAMIVYRRVVKTKPQPILVTAQHLPVSSTDLSRWITADDSLPGTPATIMIAPGQSQLRATEVRRHEPERPTRDVETAAKARCWFCSRQYSCQVGSGTIGTRDTAIFNYSLNQTCFWDNLSPCIETSKQHHTITNAS